MFIYISITNISTKPNEIFSRESKDSVCYLQKKTFNKQIFLQISFQKLKINFSYEKEVLI